MEIAWNISECYQVSEIELVYKTKVKANLRPQISGANDVYQVLMNAWDLDKIELLEEFKVVFLNRSNRVLGIYNLSSGGTTGTICDIKLIFVAALKSNAHAVILAHNHPSGNLKPSEADKQMTQKVKQAGVILDINVLDHLIVTKDGYFAFGESGLI